MDKCRQDKCYLNKCHRIAFKQNATESFAVQAEVTLKTNYWDNKRACEILFPILNSGARVVNVSSSVGFLGHLINRVS